LVGFPDRGVLDCVFFTRWPAARIQLTAFRLRAKTVEQLAKTADKIDPDYTIAKGDFSVRK